MIFSCRKSKHDLRSLGRFPVRKVWRTPVEKAAGGQEYEWLHQVADEAAPEVQRKFLDAIRRLRGTPKEAELQEALKSGDTDRVLAALGLDQDIQAVLAAHLSPALTAVVGSAGTAALDATPAIATLGGGISMRFDITNPHTVRAVRTRGFELIQQVSDDTRSGIRAIVANAMEFGGHPYDQARQIRSLIGLTDSQAEAVANFRRMLEEGDSSALTRALRDKRFDGTLRRALGPNPTVELAPEQIDRQVERYAARMLDARAKTIARTETITAARIGTQEAWGQAADHGLLNRTTLRQGWLVVPDDRLCAFCAPVPLMNPAGVALADSFETPLGPVDGPTLHPNCRCVLYLMGV